MMRDVCTIPELLRRRVDRTPDDAGMFELRAGEWQPVAWSAYWELVRRTAFGLERLGLGPGRRIAVIAATSLEWM
jgi:long-chain acyl-CoA synthetase